MSVLVSQATWPLPRLGEALEAAARGSGLRPRAVETPVPPAHLGSSDAAAIGTWIEATATWMGVEAEPVQAPYPDTPAMLRAAGPAVLRVFGEDGPRFLVILGPGRRTVPVLDPDRRVRHLPVSAVRAALCEPFESVVQPEIDQLLAEAEVPPRRRARARRAILDRRLGPQRIEGCWILRLPPGGSFWRHLKTARIPRQVLTLLGAHVTQFFLWMLSWWLIGKGALEGRFDAGWIAAWGLVLLTSIPFRVLATWAQGLVAIDGGARLKQRLLHGALRFDTEITRQQGVGQLLGRVIEAEAVEALALSGGFAGIMSVIELGAAVWVLAMGAAGGWHALALCAWAALGAWIGWRFYRRRREWTRARMEMTNDLVERMVGHRTRLAQETRERWHAGEDEALERYLATVRAQDRPLALLEALLPRGWIILGIAVLAPPFVSGAAGPAALAVSVGGILLAYRALTRLGRGFADVAGALVAWEQVAPLFHAAGREEPPGAPAFAVSPPAAATPRGGREPGEPPGAAPPATTTAAATDHGSAEHATLLSAHDLIFRYADRAEPVLNRVSLRVDAGDRLLLEGPSGGGKSTLAALLVGLRQPSSGLLLLGGLDRRTLGPDGWRRRVVAAPQFHENHVLTETFSFNVLMGRGWPPSPADMADAQAICEELGLRGLLQRMPAGLNQMVGESGWQLSHGERSRLFLARALLQGADLVILDESFAALDPENLRIALECALKRAPALLVIAHP